MALMHRCCFCCSPKSGSVVIGTLQLLSLIIGAGVIGLFLTVLQYVQDDSKVQEILQDFFEINMTEFPDFVLEIQNIQEILGKRTNVAEKILYGCLGYIGLDFLLTCIMIHGARTNAGKLLMPWVLLNGLRTCASLAGGIFMMIRKTEWAETLANELNDALDISTTTDDPGGNLPDVPTVDPQLLETTLTSLAGVLIGGSILSLYFVLVVYSQSQIIRHNLQQTKRVQHRLSIASGLLANSASFYGTGAAAGGGVGRRGSADPRYIGVTHIPMQPISVYGRDEDIIGFDNPAYNPNASTPTPNGYPQNGTSTFQNGRNSYNRNVQNYGTASHHANGYNYEDKAGSVYPSDIVAAKRRASGQFQRPPSRGDYSWQSGKKRVFSEPDPDYD